MSKGIDDECFVMNTKQVKFYSLQLDMPTMPLFKEQQELGTLPQIGLKELLAKYSGSI
jgi:hypothetical protein